MAPNLTQSQHDIINIMIPSKSKDTEIAEAAGCSPRSVREIHWKTRVLGTPELPEIVPDENQALRLLC